MTRKNIKGDVQLTRVIFGNRHWGPEIRSLMRQDLALRQRPQGRVLGLPVRLFDFGEGIF